MSIVKPPDTGEWLNQNQYSMNLNNLEDLKKELETLGFSSRVAEELQPHMQKLPSYFTLKDQRPGDTGLIDFTLHFKKSAQSDFFSFGKFEVVAGKVPPLPEGQSYMVLTEHPENPDKGPLVKRFDNPNEAVAFFNKQNGTSELAVGADVDGRSPLSSMKDGKVNYIADSFRTVYKTPMVSQTFYPDRGSGFTAEHAANLVQHRAVYRDDLLTKEGEAYKAWVTLDFGIPKDQYDNHKLKTYSVPNYGFDLEKVLDRYQLKELGDPASRAALIASLENGNRTPVTALKDGQEIKLTTEAAPRFTNINFYNESGKTEKREGFEKKAEVSLMAIRAQTENQRETRGRRVSA